MGYWCSYGGAVLLVKGNATGRGRFLSGYALIGLHPRL